QRLEREPGGRRGGADGGGQVRRDLPDVDGYGWREREQADELRDMVRGDGVLHLGRRVSADRGGVELCGERRERTARVPVVESSDLDEYRLHVCELRSRDALREYGNEPGG